MRKNTIISLNASYKIFALLSTLFVLAILGKQLYEKFVFIKSEQELFYNIEANKIQFAINDSLSYAESFSIFIADKIASLDPLSNEAISALLGYKSKSYVGGNNILTATLVDFVSPNGEIIVSDNVSGVSSQGKIISDSMRSWMTTAQQVPWKLHIDKLSIGMTSGAHAIPTGLGVTSYKDEKFLGIVSTGVDAKKINAKIKEYLDRKNTEYLVLNNALEPMVFSSKWMLSSDLSKLRSLAKTLKASEGNLNESFKFNNVNFRYYKKDSNYSYTILVGVVGDEDFNVFIDSVKENFNTSLVVLMGFTVILYFFSKMMLTPIMLLSYNALSVARGKKTQYHPNINTQDAANLARAIAMVQDSLVREKEIQAELQQANISLEDSVEQRTAELETSLKANNEFINSLSHEIRTPIHGINALSIGLVDNWNDLEDDEAYKLSVNIATNSQRLLSLVSNILDVAKAQHGDVILHLQNININKLIEDMVEECRSLYLFKKNVVLQFEADGNIDLLVDPDKITQVLRNILSNAIKVTKKGTIAIALKMDNGFVHIAISDEGMGIPQNELKTIFESFAQSTRTKGQIVGVGLGLPISQKIVEAHGGKIWAQNNDNKGATFTFTLPISRVMSNQEKQETHLQDLVKNSSHANILVIDDEDSCLLAVEMISHNTNHVISSYVSPKDAMEWLESNPDAIDLIMVDMMIPEMSGIEFVKMIKANPNLADIPVVLQSGTSDDDKIQNALDLGAVDFIRKPYNQETFILAVERNLKKSV